MIELIIGILILGCFFYGFWKLLQKISRTVRNSYEQYSYGKSTMDLAAQYELGANCEKSKNYEDAARWYQKAADGGYAQAQYSLGGLYFKGEGVEKDYNKAIELYRMAAENGNEDAKNALKNLGVEGV